MSFTVAVIAILSSLPTWCCAAGEEMCYTSGGVAGIVIATAVVTLLLVGVAAAALRYLWKPKIALIGNGKKPGSVFFGSTEKGCSLERHQPSEKQPLEAGGKEAYAFDNPYFKDDEPDLAKANQDAAEKGESGYRTDNGDVKISAGTKLNAGGKPKKNRPFSNINFPNMFHPGSKKARAMDDTFIPKRLERVEVPLRGHDFTGLGFNICGNMRDGIFVKDVLHRGPASESGKIKAGDRIVGVRVSFGGMVYEDALTILSYASPYDVLLELEKTAEADRGRHLVLPASSPTSKTRLVSSSFRTGQRLFHPLYRSQSFDDLTQIGKDNNFRINSGSNGNSNSNGSPSSKNAINNCPKRSQSIETASTPKSRVHLEKSERETKTSRNKSGSTSSHESTETAQAEGQTSKIVATPPKVKSSRFHVENILLQKKEAPDTSLPPVEDLSLSVDPRTEDEQQQVKAESEVVETPQSTESFVADETAGFSSETEEDRPTAPPRKVGIHVKRKAPAPPPRSIDVSDVTETSAIVHRDPDDISDQLQSTSEESVSLSELRDKDVTRQEDLADQENDAHSVYGGSLEASTEEETSTKRKASSLGDLTKLESGSHRKSPATATILERAVSLDLQQSLPEGKLVKQKMILRTPTFEDPEDGIRSEDVGNVREKKSPGNLTRWEGSWSKFQSGTTEDSELEKQIQGIWTVSAKTVANGHAEISLTGDNHTFDPAMDQHLHSTPKHGGNAVQLTSTPMRNIMEADSFFKNDVDIDDIPYLGDQQLGEEDGSSDTTCAVSSASVVSSRPPTSPISLSIPIIKPDFSQYEKLPSPAYSAKSQSAEPLSRSSNAEKQLGSETSSVKGQDTVDQGKGHSSYKPVFSVEASSTSPEDGLPSLQSDSSPPLSVLDIVNGNGLDSSSFDQYRTASEESSSSAADVSFPEPSVMGSKPTKELPAKKQSLTEISSIKVHSGAAGFAKTLIISTPIEGESISLNADLDSPPPQLEPPQ